MGEKCVSCAVPGAGTPTCTHQGSEVRLSCGHAELCFDCDTGTATLLHNDKVSSMSPMLSACHGDPVALCAIHSRSWSDLLVEKSP